MKPMKNSLLVISFLAACSKPSLETHGEAGASSGEESSTSSSGGQGGAGGTMGSTSSAGGQAGQGGMGGVSSVSSSASSSSASSSSSSSSGGPTMTFESCQSIYMQDDPLYIECSSLHPAGSVSFPYHCVPEYSAPVFPPAVAGATCETMIQPSLMVKAVFCCCFGSPC